MLCWVFGRIDCYMNNFVLQSAFTTNFVLNPGSEELTIYDMVTEATGSAGLLIIRALHAH